MKIGVFSEVPTFDPILPNGVSSFIEATSVELARLGHDVHIYEAKSYFGQAGEEDLTPPSAPGSITIHRLFSLPVSHYQGIRVPIPIKSVLFRGIKEKFDVIHSHGPINGLAATAIAKAQNCVKVVHYHTPGEFYKHYAPAVLSFVRSGLFVDGWEKLIYNSFDMILTPAEQIRKRLVEKKYDARKIFVLPNCVDLHANHKRITDERAQELRNQYGVNGKKVVVYVGRMSPEKRIPDIISLVPRIIKEEPNTHFLMVGKGPYLEEYKILAHKVAPRDITFTGYVSDEDLANILHLGQLGVIFVDGAQVFDITLLNYWSNHMAVCARRAGGMGDVITHMDNGLLFRKKDEAFHYIINLLQDENLCKKLGEQGYETVAGKYSVEQVTQQMLRYYKLAADEFRSKRDNLMAYFMRFFKRLRKRKD